MNKLFLKLFRDIRKSLGLFLAITAVSAIGVALLTGFSVTHSSLKNMTDSYYRQGNLADLTAYYLKIDDTGINQIKNISGVTGAYGRITIKASAATGKSDFLIHSVSSDEKIDIPLLSAGNLPQGDSECMVDAAWAKANKISIGNQISAVINGQTYNLTVSGIFNTAEYVYLVEDPAKDPEPDHATYGLLYVDKSMINTLTGSSTYTEALVMLAPNADVTNIKTEIANLTAGYGFGHITMQKDQPSFSQLQSDIDTVKAISASFPYIFFLVAAVIIFISMSRTIQTERGQIGIMKALGIKTPVIMMHYLSYAVLCGLVGGILGNLLGVFLIPQFMLGTYAKLYTFPAIVISGFWLYVTISTIVVVLFGIIASILSTRNVLREMPAQCMRPLAHKKTQKIWFEKHQEIWSRISYKNKLILRNIFLNKQRAVLSSIGIIGCVGVLMCGFGLKESINTLITNQFSKMQKFDDMVLLTKPVSYDAPVPFNNSNIARTDKLSLIPATMILDKDFSTELYVLPQSNGSIQLFSNSGAAMSLPADGILLPYKLSQEYHIKVGDSVAVRLESPLYNNATIQVKVAGIDVLYLSQDIYMSDEYLQTLGVTPYVNGYYIDVNSKMLNGDTISYFNSVANVRSVVSSDTLRKSMASATGTMNTLFILMIIMSAALALAVIYNISSINIFERRRDIATLKVLGYHKNEINSLVSIENLVITAFGCIFGVLFGAVIYKYLLIITVSADMYLPYKISFGMVALSIVFTFAFTLITNFMLRGKINSIDMVESLKGVE
jgi:putative ABC transport system permease protein